MIYVQLLNFNSRDILSQEIKTWNMKLEQFHILICISSPHKYLHIFMFTVCMCNTFLDINVMYIVMGRSVHRHKKLTMHRFKKCASDTSWRLYRDASF